jgi:hypothetical protein|tara:strand:+ start:4102 stop:4446 length:345 start_codon:yes stop_codon:yes gene_type:complete
MKKKTCAWCHKPTNLPEVFAADTPILDWFEQKIEKYCTENGYDKDVVWGLESDWNSVELSDQFEAELLTYDELMVTVSRKTICKDCLVDDQKLWDKYYSHEDHGDFEITIDDLK